MNNPKLIMRLAAKGCAKRFHLGFRDDQPHATAESKGKVPIQKAVIIAKVDKTLGAAADARTKM